MHNFQSPMTQGRLRIKRLDPRAIMPQYQSAGAAGFDLHVVLPDGEKRYINHQSPMELSTGLAFEVPEGWMLQVYSRSGHGFKNSVRLVNCTGIIDSDYRGELRVKLCTDADYTSDDLIIAHGDRIAQAVLVPAPQFTLAEVEELSGTVRGAGGFGSTGP